MNKRARKRRELCLSPAGCERKNHVNFFPSFSIFRLKHRLHPFFIDCTISVAQYYCRVYLKALSSVPVSRLMGAFPMKKIISLSPHNHWCLKCKLTSKLALFMSFNGKKVIQVILLHHTCNFPHLLQFHTLVDTL